MIPDFNQRSIRYAYFKKYIRTIETVAIPEVIKNPSKLVQHKANTLALILEDMLIRSSVSRDNLANNYLVCFLQISPKAILPNIAAFYKNQKSYGKSTYCKYGAALAMAGYCVTRFEEVYRLHDRRGKVLETINNAPMSTSTIFVGAHTYDMQETNSL